MYALLVTIDLLLATAAIYASVQLHNVLTPKHGRGMSRQVRQWLTVHMAKDDHILIGAVVVGLHGVLGTFLAICCMPYAALVVCVCAFINSARVMQVLAQIKFQLHA